MVARRVVRAALLTAAMGVGCGGPPPVVPDAGTMVGVCTDGRGSLSPAGQPCRPAAGPCDVAEVCTGSSPDCPADALAPPARICREPAGACDAAEACDGTSAQCPPDVSLPENTVCRDAAGPGTGVCHGLACESDPENVLWPLPPESPTDYQVEADTVTDRVTGLLWQRDPSPGDLDFADAQAYCQGLSLGGFSSGWRLPSLIELLSIVDSGASAAPTLNATAFPGTQTVKFWTSTAGNQTTMDGEHWGVDFASGGNWRDRAESDGSPRTISHARVRCVRSEPQAPRPRFTIGAETVRDEVTGLTWERWPAVTRVDQAGAEAYCQGLALDGGGWRLPRKKELESLQDRRAKDQAIDTPAFGDVSIWFFWTTTPCALEVGQSWVAGVKQGSVTCLWPTDRQDVRCVR